MADRPDDLVRGVEAALFAAEEPMTAEVLSAHLGGADVREALRELEAHYRERGVRLVERGRRWQFQTSPDLAHLLRREREQVRKLSRAATEAFGSGATHHADQAALIAALRPELRNGVIALIKGSRSSAMDRVIAALLENGNGGERHAA